jgi:hypothetical protein
VLEIVVGFNFALQVVNGRLNPGMMAGPLEGQEHEGGGTRNRLGEPAKNVAVAVVNATGVVGPIQ